MSIELEIAPPRVVPVDEDDVKLTRAPLVGALPAGWTLTERATGVLRAYLERHELYEYHVFFCADLDLDGIDRCLAKIEAHAEWETVCASTVAGETPQVLTHGPKAARFWPSGILPLPKHEVIVARWYWVDEYTHLRTLWLAAAPSTDRYLKLRDLVRQHRRTSGNGVWQIIRDGWGEPERLPRGTATAASLTLDPALRQRLEGDIVRFFSSEVAAMYAGLAVPYRRGVLLHGPPGNGKTSLIKLVAALLPEVPMLLVRPSTRFNADALQKVLERWSTQAPAVLVIEDLDWLLKQVNISAFLNAIDGIDAATPQSDRSGLLLIATTNHPEQLDPAINNRPGRFDIVIELLNPDASLREAFFRDKLISAADAAALAAVSDELLRQTDGLSFAHLQEILRASGLAVIHAGRPHRTGEDLLTAAAAARNANEQASRGFPIKPDAPFGLTPRKK